MCTRVESCLMAWTYRRHASPIPYYEASTWHRGCRVSHGGGFLPVQGGGYFLLFIYVYVWTIFIFLKHILVIFSSYVLIYKSTFWCGCSYIRDLQPNQRVRYDCLSLCHFEVEMCSASLSTKYELYSRDPDADEGSVSLLAPPSPINMHTLPFLVHTHPHTYTCTVDLIHTHATQICRHLCSYPVNHNIITHVNIEADFAWILHRSVWTTTTGILQNQHADSVCK